MKGNTMSAQKHTPGRLEMAWNGREGRYEFMGADGAKLGHFCGWSADGVTTEQEDHANAARLRDCYNACEGINPGAVPGLLAALRDLVRKIERDNLHNIYGIKLATARAALALAQVQS